MRAPSGGTSGNEELTTTTSVVLIVLLAVLGLTIVRIGQLIWLHLFLGLLLLGPVALKLASTGYRFVRYYTRNAAYRDKGPPELALRLIAPIVVITTIVVFVSGIVLLFHGPQNRGELLTIHKVSFIVWLVFMGLHVLGHLPRLRRSLRVTPTGRAGRWIALAGVIVAGTVIAVALIPQYGAWNGFRRRACAPPRRGACAAPFRPAHAPAGPGPHAARA